MPRSEIAPVRMPDISSPITDAITTKPMAIRRRLTRSTLPCKKDPDKYLPESLMHQLQVSLVQAKRVVRGNRHLALTDIDHKSHSGFPKICDRQLHLLIDVTL